MFAVSVQPGIEVSRVYTQHTSNRLAHWLKFSHFGLPSLLNINILNTGECQPGQNRAGGGGVKEIPLN
jgi:hypothetical protein